MNLFHGHFLIIIYGDFYFIFRDQMQKNYINTRPTALIFYTSIKQTE